MKSLPLSTNVSRLLTVCVCTAFLTLSGCGAGGGSGGDEADSDAPQAPAFFVDAIAGDDANSGTTDFPLRTITKALELVAPGETVRVRSGRYDANHGERFPIRVPAGVSLVGDVLSIRDVIQFPFPVLPTTMSAKVVGTGVALELQTSNPSSIIPFATMIVGENSSVSGFEIRGSELTSPDGRSYTTLALPHPGASIRYSLIFGGPLIGGQTDADRSNGVVAMGDGEARSIDLCRISNSEYGLRALDTGLSVETSIINDCSISVFCHGEGLDLGGGDAGSLGGNSIYEGEKIDIIVSANTVALFADNNYWDASPPVIRVSSAAGADGDGTDIWIRPGTFLSVAGSRKVGDVPVLDDTLSTGP